MRLEHEIAIHREPQAIWDAISNPRRALEFLDGFVRWDVEGAPERGLGARYSIRMKVGTAFVGGLVEVVEFDPPRELAWTSVTGIDHRGRWRLRPGESGGTRTAFRLSATVPGGVFGWLADWIASAAVGASVERTLENLRRQMESGEA